MSIVQTTAGILSGEKYRKGMRARIRRWAKKRQGADKLLATLESRRIYILPTTVGLVFGLMVFTMLLGSMNYNNNLSFVLTFLLAGIGLVSMHQCQRNLVGLEIAFAGVDPVHAGQVVEFRIAVTNHSRNRRPYLQVYCDGYKSGIGDLDPGESRIFVIEMPTSQRGLISLSRFGVRTLFPFEIFRSWAWLHMDLSGLVYPSAAEDVADPPPSQSAQGHRQHDLRGEEDFAGLKRFNVGDSPRQVAWKAYAKSGDLLSKVFSGADTSSQWFEFDAVESDDLEERLSVLTRWVIDADRSNRDYGLRIPGAEFTPAHGEAHRHQCLEALALFNNNETSLASRHA